MDTLEKRRGQCRYIRHDKLFVQLRVSSEKVSSEKVDAVSVTLLCHSCDASINGLKIEADREMEINSPVELWLAFEGLEKKFYLHGRVCWCVASEEIAEFYQIGIELDEAHATDYADWIELLSCFSD